MFNIPILYIVFNRLDTVKQTFPVIRKQKPAKIYIAADGPRQNKNGEKEQCLAVRKWILNNIDWQCEVKTLFRDENLGCKYGVSGAIKWFFQNESKGIVMEDDILATDSFFSYCEKMLNWYMDDKTVGFVSGYSFSQYIDEDSDDYFLSTIPGVWGWASWSDRIKDYNPDNASYKKNIKTKTIMINKFAEHDLLNNSLLAANGDINTWDYQMSDYMMSNNMYTIYPKKNLIRNCGFVSNSTHTATVPYWYIDASYEFNFSKVEKLQLNKKYAIGYEKTHIIPLWRKVRMVLRKIGILRFIYFRFIKKKE